MYIVIIYFLFILYRTICCLKRKFTFLNVDLISLTKEHLFAIINIFQTVKDHPKEFEDMINVFVDQVNIFDVRLKNLKLELSKHKKRLSYEDYIYNDHIATEITLFLSNLITILVLWNDNFLKILLIISTFMVVICILRNSNGLKVVEENKNEINKANENIKNIESFCKQLVQEFMTMRVH